MSAPDKTLRQRLRWRNRLLLLCALILVGIAGYTAIEFRAHWDVSQSSRNSLSQASIDILQKLDGPVDITVYATRQDAQLGDIRGIISNFVSVYQRFKTDLSLQFIDPVEHPQSAEEESVRLNGEIIIRYNDRKERLTTINEQAFTNALIRLARPEDKRLLILSGHGERKMEGVANRDMGDFGQKLVETGFVSQSLNFIEQPGIPNGSVLVIASPQIDLLPGEVQTILDYLDQGGNLLWLVDAGPLFGLLPLAEKLDVLLTPGVIVDPQASRLRAPMTFALGTFYAPHAITENFDYITVFPFARQLILEENSDWHRVMLTEAASQGWVETGALDDEIAFDEASDVPGPVGVAVALSRVVDDQEQRVIVVGSGHFLANRYLGNGGNLDFGLNMVNWLAGDEALISIQPRATSDSQLTLSETALTVIVSGFLIALPVLFLICGVVIGWRRKRR